MNFQWVETLGDARNIYDTRLAIDDNNNLLVAASMQGNQTIDFDPGPGQASFTSQNTGNTFFSN